MKACLMRVNYDPKYTSPHKPYQNFYNRLHVTKEIYTTGNGHDKSKRKDITLEDQLKYKTCSKLTERPSNFSSAKGIPKKYVHDTVQPKQTERKTKAEIFQSQPDSKNQYAISVCHKPGDLVKKGKKQEHIVRLCDISPLLKSGPSKPKALVSSNKNYAHESDQIGSRRSLSFQERNSLISSKCEFPLDVSTLPGRRSKTVLWDNVRNKTQQSLEQKAKFEAHKAMKNKKIFTILGPYHSLRHALRRRGWVERFNDARLLERKQLNKTKQLSSGDFDENSDQCVNECVRQEPLMKENCLRPWDEDDGLYGLMSNELKNSKPTFIFTVKSNDVDSKVTNVGQLVNHFSKARSFTTKVGLCQNIRYLPWYNDTDPDSFFPKCFRLNDSDEKDTFIDEFRIMSCIGLLRHLVLFHQKTEELNSSVDPDVSTMYCRTLNVAIQQCQQYLEEIEHAYLDLQNKNGLCDDEWNIFLQDYHKLIRLEKNLCGVVINQETVDICTDVLRSVSKHRPQFAIEGYRNVWILKPGAKSRGRGIQCMDNLQQILSSITSQIEPTCSMVIQKYIERPLLISNTKFDIRQWFLVTNWNPLTVWLYNEFYLRFCSHEFSLDNFHASIHLSNHSVQKKYLDKLEATDNLPKDRMWLNSEFETFLRERDLMELYEERVVPGMKRAIISSLLCTQWHVEERKNAFELYGADFVLTEDFHPWLLEINSSPSMSRSTRVTSKLVDSVLEDTLKVVLDRKIDKKCDTGGFNLILKNDIVADKFMSDPALSLTGKKMRQRIFLGNKTNDCK